MASSDVCAAAALLLAGCASAPVRGGGAGRLPVVEAQDGTQRSLEALTSGHDATVLVFWSASCPCVRRYQARVDALLERVEPGRLQVFAVVSNAGEAFDDALRVARERDVKVPLLHDAGGALATFVGARSTPTVVVLDRSAQVRFLGWLDNEREPGATDREPWLERALDGLKTRQRFTARTPTWGCTLTKALFPTEPRACSAAH